MTARAQLDLDLRARVEQTGTIDGTGTPEAERRPGYTVTILDAQGRPTGARPGTPLEHRMYQRLLGGDA